MFAFSVGSECRSPSDFNGGVCLPSDLLCLVKVQNRFIVLPLFPVSRSDSVSLDVIPSMYFQYARRISFCVERFRSLNFVLSPLCPDFLERLYHLSLFLLSLLKSDVIHGHPSFFRVVFYWYIAFNAFLKASLKMIPDGIDGMVHFLHGINGILY